MEVRTGPFPASIKVAVVTAAVSAGFAGGTEAAPVTFTPADSTSAGAGLPVTLTLGTPSSQDIDINRDGQVDFTLQSTTEGIFVNTGGNAIDTFFGYVSERTPGSSFDTDNLKLRSGAIPIVSYQDSAHTTVFPNFPSDQYTAVTLFDSSSNAYLGYIDATLNITQGDAATSTPGSATYTVTDFGDIPLPEPTSLALLATGAAGLAAFRRRRTPRPA